MGGSQDLGASFGSGLITLRLGWKVEGAVRTAPFSVVSSEP